MIKILHIISPGSGYFGGIETYLCEYYQQIDRRNIRFDFAFCGENTLKLRMYEPLFSASKFCEYHALYTQANKLKNWISLFMAIKCNLKNEHYNIVEIHSSSPLIEAVCGIALIGTGVPIKIVHSHALSIKRNNLIHSILVALCTLIISKCYDMYFSCSYEAASIFGGNIVRSNRFKKINNAVDYSKYKFDPIVRKNLRLNNAIDDDTVIVGHVARLSRIKNQKFLIEVFNEYHRLNYKSVLWIIGDGECRTELECMARDFGIDKSVKFFGERKDVYNLLQAMDIFVITSLQEGLCISAIESQMAGLPTIVSDGVPKECMITSRCTMISLSDDADSWANAMEKLLSSCKDRDCEKEILESGYVLKDAAVFLQKIYLEQFT